MLPLFCMNDIFTSHNDIWPLFEAVPREELTNSILSYGVFVSFVLLAIAKIAKPSVFQVLAKVFLRNSSINQLMRENYNTLRVTDFVLLLNFWLMCTLGSIFYLNIKDVPLLIHVLWPIVLHVCLLLPLFVMSFVSGAKVIIRENVFNFFLVPQFFSLILLPIVLIGHLNVEIIVPLGWSFLIIVVLMYLYINVRGIVFAFRSGISLYYIILYICTLEFLPLSVFFSAFVANRY